MDKSEEIQTLLQVAKSAAQQGSQILKKYYGALSSIKEKIGEGLVTEADQNSEKLIVEIIRKSYPLHDILGEESGENYTGKSPYRWYIDPLDGTNNYVHLFPFFCVSIGLYKNDEPILGVVNAPMLNLEFSAGKNLGANLAILDQNDCAKYLSESPLKIFDQKELSKCLVSTGFSVQSKKGIKEQTELFYRVIPEVRGVRRTGSAALDLCFFAKGSFQVFWESQLKPWDMAAGAIICQEAGGTVTDFKGKTFTPKSDNILVTTPSLSDEVVSLIDY